MNVDYCEFRLSGLIIFLKHRLDQPTLMICMYKHLNWFYGQYNRIHNIPDDKVHEANMGPTWILSAPDGPHVGSNNLAIRDVNNI